jgi:hypothetical protein
MRAVLEFLNGREAALAIWLAIGFVWIACNRDLRASFGNVLRTFIVPKVSGVILVAAGYASGFVWLLHQAGWSGEWLVKDSIYWFAGTALVALMNVPGKDERFIWRFAVHSFALVVFLEFLMNLYTFPLYIEVWLLPLTVLAIGTLALAERDRRYVASRKPLKFVVTVLGLALLGGALIQAFLDLADFASVETIRRLAVVPVLTILFTPFLYLLAVVTAYELVFMRIRFALRDDVDSRTLWRIRWSIIQRCGIRLQRINRFSPEVMPALFAASNDDEARNAIDAFPSQTPR